MNVSEKYIKNGYDSLDDLEILKLLLYISDCNEVEKKSDELMSYYGNLQNILSSNSDLDTMTNKINKKFTIILSLLKDYTKDLFFSKLKKKNIITSSTIDVVSFLKNNLAYLKDERFDVIFLSNTFEVINYKTISKGTIDKSVVFIRNIIGQVLDCNAKYIIITHNHPSGSLKPSKQDIEITKNIKKIIKLIDVDLVDHLIISTSGYFSFAEGGLL
ncbi:JAB domain-containing protein [Caviibacter abscessus]|uniref:JAB domain-containing protein n=1 Tax=Caviibacter abscessus TaxID=1766719 RepID=UPI0008369997|nr:DNA repair protein RadC [Caviibacter abscessus]